MIRRRLGRNDGRHGVVPPARMYLHSQLSQSGQKATGTGRDTRGSWAGQFAASPAPRRVERASFMFDSFSLISSFGMKAISITFLLPPRPPRPDPPFPVAPSRALLASNGENIGQAIIGLLLYGYIARGAAPSQTESNPRFHGRGRDGRGWRRGAARRGHFGSEPGAKLFDPAILDFGLGGGGGERTDSAVLCTAVTDDEYEVQRSA